MKRLIQYVFLLAIIGVSGYLIYQKTLTPCDKPLGYSIGRFDTQFGVSKEDFKSYIAESGAVWEKVIDRKIFIYNPNSDFKVNLIYDQRQLETLQKQKTEYGLSAAEDIFKQLDANFTSFKNQYDQMVSDYENALATFQTRKSAYESEVAGLGNRRNVSQDKLQSLEAERQYLNSEAQRLNSQTTIINQKTQELNALLAERNAKASEYNKIAQNYNKEFSGGLEFNQAEYLSSSVGKSAQINVYQFGNKKDLILALTHELGHALGMDHVENPKSIMYYITGINAQTLPTPTPEDLAELKRVCKM